MSEPKPQYTGGRAGVESDCAGYSMSKPRPGLADLVELHLAQTAARARLAAAYRAEGNEEAAAMVEDGRLLAAMVWHDAPLPRRELRVGERVILLNGIGQERAGDGVQLLHVGEIVRRREDGRYGVRYVTADGRATDTQLEVAALLPLEK